MTEIHTMPDVLRAVQFLKDAGYDVTLRALSIKPTISNSEFQPGDTFVLKRTGGQYMRLDSADSYRNPLYWNVKEKHSTTLDARSEVLPGSAK